MQADSLPAGYWLMFQPGADEDAAAAVFVRKYGRPPEYIREVTSRLWLGPVPVVQDAPDRA